MTRAGSGAGATEPGAVVTARPGIDGSTMGRGSGSPAIHVTSDAARHIARVANGRDLAIGFFATRCCTSTLVGDFTTQWVAGKVPARHTEVGTVGTTRIVADERLFDLLASGGAEVVMAGRILGRSLSVRLDDPERWLAFLERPAARGARHAGPLSIGRPRMDPELPPTR